jgi:nitrous oxidase accessory protein NosD
MKHKITLLLVAVFTTVVTAQTVKIDGTTYPSISEAIAAASDGDVIDITGTHTGFIDRKSVV